MIANFLKNRDAFGHHISFTVKDGDGNAQTSKFSGFISVILYLFIFTYTIIKFENVESGKYDLITLSEDETDSNEKFNLTNLMPFFEIITDNITLTNYVDLTLIQKT